MRQLRAVHRRRLIHLIETPKMIIRETLAWSRTKDHLTQLTQQISTRARKVGGKDFRQIQSAEKAEGLRIFEILSGFGARNAQPVIDCFARAAQNPHDLGWVVAMKETE